MSITDLSLHLAGGPAAADEAIPLTQTMPADIDFVLAPAETLRGSEIVFVDGDVPDLALLQQSMGAGRELYVLDSGTDGLAQMASILAGRSGISALHVVTHGAEGTVALGGTTLNTDTLAQRQADLQAIGRSLSPDGDILLYGCDVGAGDGKLFLDALAAVTGADVAASDDLTGAAAKGGDWELEIRSGNVEAKPAVDASLITLYGDVLALNNVTAGFAGNFLSSGGYSNASQDVTYKVSGNASYVLKIDGANAGVYGFNSQVYIADGGTETLVTFSFTGGQIFTPSSMLVGNVSSNPAQTLVFKGYDSGNGLVASQNLNLGAGTTSGTINFSGFNSIATLKLTASSNGGNIKWLYLDDLVLTTVTAADSTPPTVSGVTSSTANGSYKAGDVIAIQVNFSETVTVTGTPQLTLETGSTDRAVNYASGSGTSTLTFNYTVQAGDTSADLDYLGTAALALNGGTIKDAAGNSATLTLASPGAANSLGANKNLVVDGVAPAVTGVTSSTANGSYKAGDVIAIQANFSEAVTVTGTPQLTLETGSTDRAVNYASGSGTSTLTFNYTVQAGDTSADLDFIGTTALALNGGTVKDAAGNSATLTLASPGAANSLGANKNLVVDGVVPVVTGVTSSTANGSCKAGDVIAIQVNFSEAVTVTGTPQLTLETGTTDQVVNYASGSGTSTLTFNYTVQAGDTSADLDYLSTAALTLNGGTITDATGNNATLTLANPGAANSLGANKNLVIDTAAPTVSGVTSSTANGSYKAGDVIAIQVNFSEAVTVTGTPQLTLETGATDQVVDYVSGSGTSTLTFNYTVQAGDTSADLDYLSTAALVLNGGTVTDAAGNDATLTLASPGAANSLGANKNLVIDTSAPAVTGVTSSTANGSYKVGDVIAIQVNFSEAVTVTGTPQLTLETGATDQVVNYASGSGTSTLTFNYTVQAGDTSADLDFIGTTALALNGGTVKDAAGNNATLTLASPGAANSLGANKNLVVDGVVPAVTGVTSSTANGSCKAGDVIAIQVNFSESVTVTGTPQLTLETGATDQVVNYVSGSGTSTLTFNYTVQAGDTSADLDYLSTAALALNGGTITDATGNNAALTLASPGAANSLGANKNLVIDTAAPTVSGVTSSTANGSYKAGDVIAIQVNFSEAVTVTGTPQLTLETGTTDQVVDYASGSGTSTLTFNYTVQAGDTSADLDFIGTTALALNGGTITDATGNNATLTLANPGAANSLGANKNIAIDTSAPSITLSGMTLSNDTGASASDFVTSTAAQTVSATLSAGLGAGEKLYGSVDNGSHWSDITSMVSGTTLTWAGATLGTGTSALQLKVVDAAGNEGTSLSKAYTLDTTSPVFQSATVNDATLVISYTEASMLDAANVPAAGNFTVTVGNAASAVNAVAVNAVSKTVTLTLASAAGYGQVVTVAYTDPTGGNDASAIQDSAGNDAATLVSTNVTNNTAAPSPDTPPVTTIETTVDGITIEKQIVTGSGGSVTQKLVIPVVTDTRQESVGNNTVADIPLVSKSDGSSVLSAQVPAGMGLVVSGQAASKPASSAVIDLVNEIKALTATGSTDQAQLTGGGTGFLDSLPSTTSLLVQTIVPTVASGTSDVKPLNIIAPPAGPDKTLTALVIDGRNLPPGTEIDLRNVDFAAVIGNLKVTGGEGSQRIFGDSQSQYIMLGADDDELHGGGGDDTVGSEGGNDRLFGDDGNDTLFGGAGQDLIAGGAGNDSVTYARSRADYAIERNGAIFTVRSLADPTDADTLVNVEAIKFADETVPLSIDSAPATATQVIAGLYAALYGRAPDSTGLQYWINQASTEKAGLHDIATAMSNTAKFDQLYAPGLSTADFVAQIYQNILGIAGDADGRAYWSGQIDAGLRRTEFVADFVTAALNFDAQVSNATGADLANATRAGQTLAHKVSVGLHFAAALAAKSDGAVDSTAWQQSIDVLSGVNESSASVESAVVKIDLIGGHTGFGSAVAQGAIFA